MNSPFIFLAIYLVISYVLFQVAFNRNVSKRFLRKSKDLSQANWSFFKPDQAWLLSLNPTMLEIDVKGSKRCAYFLDAFGKKAETVIIIHGYTSQALSMALFARLYVEQFKMNALLIDLKGHGLSEGSLIQFGLGDYPDINHWVHTLNNLGYTQTKVIHGISMGAATALFSLANGLEKEVRAIVCDSGFMNIDPIFKRQALKIFKAPSLLFIPGLSFWMKLKCGFTISQVNVFKQLHKIDRPLLLIHGTADFFVPYTQSLHLHELFKETKLQLFKDSQHACSVNDNRELYIQTLKEFLY